MREKNKLWSIIVCIAVFSINLLSFNCSCANADGFSNDPDEIEKAAKSVLKLEVYDFFGRMIKTGSGFVAFDNNTLVTNYHVIENSSKIIANSDDGEQYSIVAVCCCDEDMDIAIVQLEDNFELNPLPLRAEKNLKRSSPVVAIGSPIGIKNTVSIGNISAVYEEDGIPWIQFTAPISQGSSGGALFNDSGEVIGVTSASYTRGQNLNLAINISVAKAMYNAWDNHTWSLIWHKSHADLDFSKVYDDTITSKAVTSSKWVCIKCGAENSTNFCMSCGAECPSWICSCGTQSIGNFCGNCGNSVESLIAKLNEGIEYKKDADFQKAIDVFSGLSAFDSGSFETAIGKHIIAAELIPVTNYDWGMYVWEKKGDWENAVKHISDSSAKDADEQIYNIYFLAGQKATEAGNYTQAIGLFSLIPDNESAIECINECYFKDGESKLNRQEYQAALSCFEYIKNVKDVSEKIKQIHYCLGQELIEEGKYLSAVEEYTLSEGYSDSSQRILEAYYLQGDYYYSLNKYDSAIEMYQNSKGYKDAAEKILATYYSKGMASLNALKYDDAISAFIAAKDYSDASEKAKDALLKKQAGYYNNGIQFLKDNKYDNAIESFIKADNYSDAAVMLKEAYYQKALSYFNTNKVSEALTIIAKISDYSKATDLYCIIRYDQGKEYLTAGQFDDAILCFEDIKEYKDAKDLVLFAKQQIVNSLIEKEEFLAAYDYCTQAEDEGIALKDDIIIIQPNDHGNKVNHILTMAKNMGFLTSLRKDEMDYRQQYIDSIKRMEKHFELDEDGIILLKEAAALQQLIIPFCNGANVKALLEKLFDLGYISNRLPEEHETYEPQYNNAIKKAEKQLSLRPDGFIDTHEFQTIMEQKVDELPSPQNIWQKATSSNVTVSWSTVKGAAYYQVYRNQFLIDTITKTSYNDSEVTMGIAYEYEIYPCKYSISPKNHIKITVDVPITYENLSAKEFLSAASAYKGHYVKINQMTVVEQYWDGADYIMIITSPGNQDSFTRYAALRFSQYMEWDDGQSLANRKIKSISARGICIGRSETYQYGMIPFVECDTFNNAY